jgi:hypothetical protein
VTQHLITGPRVQVFSIITWLLETYYVYTVMLFFMSAAAVIASALQTQQNQRLLERIAKFENQVGDDKHQKDDYALPSAQHKRWHHQ